MEAKEPALKLKGNNLRGNACIEAYDKRGFGESYTRIALRFPETDHELIVFDGYDTRALKQPPKNQIIDLVLLTGPNLITLGYPWYSREQDKRKEKMILTDSGPSDPVMGVIGQTVFDYSKNLDWTSENCKNKGE